MENVYSSYLIKGGKVLSLFSRESRVQDILVEEGIVTGVEEEINGSGVERVLDARGLTVTPGWVDCHAHLYEDSRFIGVNPQRYYLSRGVTWAIDQGSAGADNISELKNKLRQETDIEYKAFLNLSRIGMPRGAFELVDEAHIHREACLEACKGHQDRILGLKLRIGSKMCSNPGGAMEAARELGEELGMPVVVHATKSSLSTEEIMQYLRSGDVFTHTYARTPSGILDGEGRVKDCIREARERGVYFDLGHGAGSFSFDTARKATAQGFWVDTVSTDLHIGNLHGPVFDMATTLSKILLLGASLEEALSLVTTAPAGIFRLHEKLLEIRVGKPADLTAFDIIKGQFVFTDSLGEKVAGDKKVVSRFTALGGKIFFP